MTKPRFDLDRSTAFTILLDIDPNYAGSVSDNGESVTAFLAAWYEDSSLDMYEFGQRYAALHPTPPNPNPRKLL